MRLMLSESLNVCVFAGNFLISNRGEVKVGDFGILRDMNEPGRARALSSMTEEKEAPESASLNNSINNNGNANGGGDGTSGVVVPAPADVNTLITSPLQRAHTFVGTATYMSPQANRWPRVLLSVRYLGLWIVLASSSLEQNAY
jgi:serine/threonine protein kinase